MLFKSSKKDRIKPPIKRKWAINSKNGIVCANVFMLNSNRFNISEDDLLTKTKWSNPLKDATDKDIAQR